MASRDVPAKVLVIEAPPGSVLSIVVRGIGMQTERIEFDEAWATFEATDGAYVASRYDVPLTSIDYIRTRPGGG